MAAVGACRCGTMRSGGTRELMAGFRAALVLGALAGLVLPTIAAPTDSASKQRNVLFMLTDDGGFEFSYYGNNVSVTPHYDALARTGMVFDRAFTAVSSCSPSRSAILSGLPTHQNGMFGLHNMQQTFASNDAVRSLPTLLNDAGDYFTCMLGKYHLGPDYPAFRAYNFSFGLDPLPGWEPSCCAGAGGTCPLPYNQVTRNITHMRACADKCLELAAAAHKPWMMYVGWGDVHRCGFESAQGSFCENYGDPSVPGQGVIPDWKPVTFKPEEVRVPPFLPDNAAVRADFAAQYKAATRMDQGLGLIMASVEAAGHANDTLVISFSDNGIPFPHAKTTLYETGMGEPLVISLPGAPPGARGARSRALVSSLDFVPTILDWTGVKFPQHYKINNHPAQLTGVSLLPLLTGEDDGSASADGVGFRTRAARRRLQGAREGRAPSDFSGAVSGQAALELELEQGARRSQGQAEDAFWMDAPPAVAAEAAGAGGGAAPGEVAALDLHAADVADPGDFGQDAVFASHMMHSIWGYYPMRVMRTEHMRLIFNVAYWLEYPILGDVWATTTWHDIVADAEAGRPTGWAYNYTEYRFRPKWELYNATADPLELHNLASDPAYNATLVGMQATLKKWQAATADPWLIKYTHE